MDGNNENINREFDSLKCSLYNHFILFLVINAFNIILFITMPFLNKVYYAFYLCCLIMYIIFFTIPFHPLILLYKKKLYTKVVICWKKLSLALIFIILFFAILINVILFLNVHYLLTFYKECPYNFSYSDIVNIFNIDYNDYINNINYPYSSKCSDNRCILFQENSESPIPISYLCNYDSSIDFESIFVKITRKIFYVKVNKENNTKIYCQEFNKDNFSNTDQLTMSESNENFYIVKSYFDICSSKNTFYQCFRYEKPKKYEIDEDFSCTKINNIIINLLIAIVAFFFNLFLSLIISIFEFMKYRKILILYRANVIESASTCGTTKNSSQARGNSNENNANNNENENANNNDIHSDTIIIKISEEEEDKGNKININDNLISTEGVLTINNRISNEINNGLEENNNTSERKGINSRFNLNLKQETGINCTNTNNSIDFRQINFNDNNDNDKNQNEIYTIKIK
jgi:hypothetical protein